MFSHPTAGLHREFAGAVDGLTLPKGRSHLDEQMPRILKDAELNLSDSFRVPLAQLKLELKQLAAHHRLDPTTSRIPGSC
jgi:hypothetical protein